MFTTSYLQHSRRWAAQRCKTSCSSPLARAGSILCRPGRCPQASTAAPSPLPRPTSHSTHLVEDVVVALGVGDVDHARALQQVGADGGACGGRGTAGDGECGCCAMPGAKQQQEGGRHGSPPRHSGTTHPAAPTAGCPSTPLRAARRGAPEMRPSALNWISVNLPKREELSLRTVLALPKASSSGLDSSTCGRAAGGGAQGWRCETAGWHQGRQQLCKHAAFVAQPLPAAAAATTAAAATAAALALLLLPLPLHWHCCCCHRRCTGTAACPYSHPPGTLPPARACCSTLRPALMVAPSL